MWLANHLPKMDHRSSKLLCFDLLYKSKLKYALLASNELIPKWFLPQTFWSLFTFCFCHHRHFYFIFFHKKFKDIYVWIQRRMNLLECLECLEGLDWLECLDCQIYTGPDIFSKHPLHVQFDKVLAEQNNFWTKFLLFSSLTNLLSWE